MADTLSALLPPLIIFFVVLLLIVFEVFDKGLIAAAGAVLMIFLGALTPSEAIAAIDFETIFLLLAMMLLVHTASRSGIFEWLQVKIATVTRGNPLAIFVLFSTITVVFSAFLDNVTTVILIVPITIELIKGMGRDPKPYVIAEMICAGIGGTLTLIGDPANVIIGTAAKLSFLEFIVNLWIPVTLVTLTVLIVFPIIYRKSIRPITKDLSALFIANLLIRKIRHAFNKRPLSRRFIIEALVALIGTLIAFLVHHTLNLPAYVIAFAGAMLLGLLSNKRVNLHESLKAVEWTTLFFFGGLFVMVAAIEKTGVLGYVSQAIANSTTNPIFLPLIILWVSGIFSMAIDNIPFVTVMVPVIIGLQTITTLSDPSILWWSLSLGACLGGNGTLIGASANVVSAGIARQRGISITFLDHLRIALPVTLGFLVISSLYLIVRIA